MTVRAYELVNLVAALKLGPVELAERRSEGPLLCLDRRAVARILCGCRRGKRHRGDRKNGGKQFRNVPHYAAPPCFASTDSVMLPGSLLGLSISPTTGMMIRKKAK